MSLVGREEPVSMLAGTAGLSIYVDMSIMWSSFKNHHTGPVFSSFNQYDVYIVIASVGTLLVSLLTEIDLG